MRSPCTFATLRLATLALCVTSLITNPTSAAPPDDQLNVLFIAVDDLRPELGCYGHEQIVSPNLDQLAANGVLFENAYCQQAVCSPSRTSLMTGMRPDTTRVFDLETHFRDTVPDVITLTQHFMQNGYQAIGMGKIYHGSLNDTASWTIPHWKSSYPAQSFNLPKNQEYMKRRRAEGIKKGLTGKPLRYYSQGPPFEAADVPDNLYPDGAVADHAIETLDQLAKQEKPFFLAVGFTKPHLPFNSPKKYWDLYDREEITVPEFKTYPIDSPDFAAMSWGELRNYQGIPAKGLVTDEQAKELIHGYQASVSFTDANIGRVIDRLDQLGLRDNTVIIVWGDHGWKLGDYGSWCKHSNFEIDTQVPMIVSMPGAKGNGQTSKALVEFVDIYPSLAELAGLDLPSHLEGSSFARVLNNPDRDWKPAAFSQYPRGGGNNKIMGYSMRTPGYRMTNWVKRDDPSQTIALELYDMSGGPTPTENLANRPEYKELVQRLLKQNQAGWKAAREQIRD